MKIYTPEEVLIKIKKITNKELDSQLSNDLEVSKQMISQYKNKKNIDLQLKIISLLIHIIENKPK
ncbi:hypothetical protein [Bathymodiolus azoricus thioautotrophic gill symbiont]|jgi:hypothetical protein|uniref:HTH cro/C1-type domain-containing protein n=1 Tax=Bathymodiolus azoricus thioautotrophic gill symbiont TaxID=235205 RepID=A0A1H6J703_9GAMM|nr:hypothetical protein [Bathymodiolus azoricus thioautotrophic gill symbiont]SEH57927.1 hypothetical protein BAZSYMA_ACONTIG08765_1 [Bathymodiolus azoricus thioautotrophic gill symbiont]VVH57490.1 hypothetical protein BAZOLSSOX_1393 [uncultured Gammaproteobacteria bacterium]